MYDKIAHYIGTFMACVAVCFWVYDIQTDNAFLASVTTVYFIWFMREAVNANKK